MEDPLMGSKDMCRSLTGQTPSDDPASSSCTLDPASSSRMLEDVSATTSQDLPKSSVAGGESSCAVDNQCGGGSPADTGARQPVAQGSVNGHLSKTTSIDLPIVNRQRRKPLVDLLGPETSGQATGREKVVCPGKVEVGRTGHTGMTDGTVSSRPMRKKDGERSVGEAIRQSGLGGTGGDHHQTNGGAQTTGIESIALMVSIEACTRRRPSGSIMRHTGKTIMAGMDLGLNVVIGTSFTRGSMTDMATMREESTFLRIGITESIWSILIADGTVQVGGLMCEDTALDSLALW